MQKRHLKTSVVLILLNYIYSLMNYTELKNTINPAIPLAGRREDSHVVLSVFTLYVLALSVCVPITFLGGTGFVYVPIKKSYRGYTRIYVCTVMYLAIYTHMYIHPPTYTHIILHIFI